MAKLCSRASSTSSIPGPISILILTNPNPKVPLNPELTLKALNAFLDLGSVRFGDLQCGFGDEGLGVFAI